MRDYLSSRNWNNVVVLTIGIFVLSQMWAQMALELPPDTIQWICDLPW